MKVRATKVMANAIAKEMKKLGVKFEEILCVKMSERQFSWLVGNPFDKCLDCDYDWNNETYSVIKISYPYEYYACNNYLSSKDLLRLFKQSDGTFDSFMKQIKDEIEI